MLKILKGRSLRHSVSAKRHEKHKLVYSRGRKEPAKHLLKKLWAGKLQTQRRGLVAERGNLSTDSPPLGSCAAIVEQLFPSVQRPTAVI